MMRPAQLSRETIAVPGRDLSAFIKRSIEWVHDHPNATNHDVPSELRDGWILPDKPRAEERKAVLAIFLAGYTAVKAKAQPTGFKAEVPLSHREVNERFEIWQLKLIMAKLTATRNTLTSPLPLFSLRDDEEVHVVI